MPKVPSSLAEKLRQYVAEHPGILTSDGKVLYCQPCGKTVSCSQKSQVTQHIQGQKHKNAVSLVTGRQQHLVEAFASSSRSESPYFMDLTEAFLAADIPFYKLSMPCLKNFLSKYTGLNTPDESTLRKLYLPKCFSKTMARIREECSGGYIWVGIDETTDSRGRKIGNVVIGVLREDGENSRSFLLNSQEMQSVNHSTTARLFNESMQLLWPDGIQYDNVLLLLTDGAAYMKKAAMGLSVSYPKMIHTVCVVHCLHRICETIRAMFPDVDRLIANGKKAFVKAPLRIEMFQDRVPDVPLPPCPVVTRWGTWLSAAIYYADHFESFYSLVQELHADDASSIAILQQLYATPTLKTDLMYIRSNFMFLIDCITTLESSQLTLIDAVREVKNAIVKIESLSGKKADKLKQKATSLFSGNTGFNTMCAIASALGGEACNTSLPENLSVKQLASFRYAKLTTCDVERTFSRYKALFRDNRQSYTSDNLRMVFITHCNAEM